MCDQGWAFFLKQGWVISAVNLLRSGNEVTGIIGGKTITIVPRTSHSAYCYIDGHSQRGIGSAEKLIDFLIHTAEDINHEQAIKEIDSIFDNYY